MREEERQSRYGISYIGNRNFSRSKSFGIYFFISVCYLCNIKQTYTLGKR